jgi:hypothetical protein
VIRRRDHRAIRDVLLLIAAGIATSACVPDGGTDFCRDHQLFHADHLDSIGRLTISLSADGSLVQDFELPSGFASTTAADELLTLQFEDDDRLRQIDVSIFDQFPDLDEVEVSMSTHVTQKRFAISRQCDRPIFRLDRQQSNREN